MKQLSAGAILLLIVAVLLLIVILSMLLNICVGGDACGNFWIGPATQTAEALETQGAREFRLMLTEINLSEEE
jgi:hypothetical protein